MLSIDNDFACRGVFDAEQDFHERGFACTVFAANGVDGASADRERHVAKRLRAVRIDLVHMAEGDDSIAAFNIFSWIFHDQGRTLLRIALRSSVLMPNAVGTVILPSEISSEAFLMASFISCVAMEAMLPSCTMPTAPSLRPSASALPNGRSSALKRS